MIPAPYRRALGAGGGGVFYLHGSDEFRKREAARAIADAHLDSSTRDFNLDVLRGLELEVPTFASVLATPPLMTEWRVVLVYGAEALASSPAARKVVLATCASPPPGLALILSATQPKGSRARFYADLKRKARSIEFRPIRPNDLPGFLMSQCRERHGVEMKEDAARSLAATAGTDLGVLAQEIAKLADMAAEGGPITVETVRRGGTRIPAQDRWRWFDLVGSRDFARATVGLEHLLLAGESGVALVSGLTTHLLRLAVARDRGIGGLEALLPPRQRWTARRLEAQSRRWTPRQLDTALLGLRRVDSLMKASVLPHEHLLETWILEQRAAEGNRAGR